MKRARNLFNLIISDENISFAIDEVNRSHRWRKNHRPNPTVAWVEETKPERIRELQKILLSGFTPSPCKKSTRWDANARKWREINEPKLYPDQYIHHALIQVLQPVFMRVMDFYCCGSVPGRGIYRAMRGIQSWMHHDRKGTKWCLTCDIRHFYDSLRPTVVMDGVRRLIKDHRTLDLIWRIIKDGILIGAYPSQWFANAVLQPLDHLIRQSGLCKHYVRYMDNFTIFGANKRKLRKLKVIIEEWLNAHGLEMKGDWQIFPTKSRLPDAVGYRFGHTYTIPRKRNFLRLKHAVARYRKRKRKRKRIFPTMAASVLSRLGQLKHCNNHNLYKRLFCGEHILRELKNIIRKSRERELIEWNTFLAQRAAQKFSRRKVTGIVT